MKDKLNKCSIKDCTEKGIIRNNQEYFPKELCSKHYYSYIKHKDPLKAKRQTNENRNKNPIYHVYLEIKQRCYNKNHKQYKDYGGRGIIMCERWFEKSVGFQNFLKDMGEKPSKNHSIDRVDNNGNYEPSNCRWATKTEQSRNRNNNIEHIGIYKTKSVKKEKWIAKITINKKQIHIGVYETKEKAIEGKKLFELNIKNG